MAVQLVETIIQQFSDSEGLLVGGQVFFYEAGSTTVLEPIYVDAAETAELANPQTLGDLGELQNVIYMNGNYNIVIFDRDGNQKFQRDNFNVSDTSSDVLSWMQDAQSANAVIGRWSTVVNEGITIAAGDVVIGDSAGSGFYELLAGGDPNNDPESDTYDPNTGIGNDWINLAISSAEITESDIDNLQDQIDDINTNFNTQGYFYGLEVSNSSGDSVNDLDFAVGTANDSTDVARITSTSAFTKAIDDVWAEGTNQGGRPTGTSLATSGWWYCFIIGKSNNPSSFDFGFDQNINATLLLNGSNAGAEGYDIYRLVDAWYWDATNTTLLQITKNGFDNYLNERITVRALAAGVDDDEEFEVICPPNGIAQTSMYMITNANLTFSDFGQIYTIGNAPTSVDESNCDIAVRREAGSTEQSSVIVASTPVNTSSQLGVWLDSNSGTVNVDWSMNSRGYYFDPR